MPNWIPVKVESSKRDSHHPHKGGTWKASGIPVLYWIIQDVHHPSFLIFPILAVTIFGLD
jgi:hypothetical protein